MVHVIEVHVIEVHVIEVHVIEVHRRGVYRLENGTVSLSVCIFFIFDMILAPASN